MAQRRYGDRRRQDPSADRDAARVRHRRHADVGVLCATCACRPVCCPARTCSTIASRASRSAAGPSIRPHAARPARRARDDGAGARRRLGAPVLAQSNELVSFTTPNARELHQRAARGVHPRQPGRRRSWPCGACGGGGAAEVLRVVFGRMTPEQLRTRSRSTTNGARGPGISAGRRSAHQRRRGATRWRWRRAIKVPKPAREAGGDCAALLPVQPAGHQPAAEDQPQLPGGGLLRSGAARYTLVELGPTASACSPTRRPSASMVQVPHAGPAQLPRQRRDDRARVHRAGRHAAGRSCHSSQDPQKLDRVVGGAVVGERLAIKSGGFRSRQAFGAAEHARPPRGAAPQA